MEIIYIKERTISPSPQVSTPGRVKRTEQPDEQASRSDAAAEPDKKVTKGDPEDAGGPPGKNIKGLSDKPMKDLTDEAIKVLSERLNKVVDAMRFSIQFVVDREAEGIVIKVLDSKGNLIRRIPPEVVASVSDIGENLGLLLNTEL